MSDPIGMVMQLAGNAARVGCYLSLNRIVERRASELGVRRSRADPPRRAIPSEREILADLVRLQLRDAAAVRDGLFPPMADETSLFELFGRARAMLADFPAAASRQQARDATSVRAVADAATMPDYYVQDFHFQTGGYLTEHSARLYDIQVETLFIGAAAAMRREALRPIAAFMVGRDQRRMALLDVACGTGRLLRSIRLAYPALALTGLDLSRPYLDEAKSHLSGLRPAKFIQANAEAIPLADASQDIVTTVFLYHELPGDVRRRVTAEIARVLKPGGLLVFIDSLQRGDRPQWDGILESFPARFHEPYYRHYLIDDLVGMMEAAGLAVHTTEQAFLAKLLAATKVG